MVSTRGPKFKFTDGEKVLCYEPDPTKAKVLYDSKVLDVIINKDQRGRKAVEYLIHFQGWNSSWDRCVTEEYVLKDTEENRQLQRDLAQKAQLQLGAYLYRRERKKRSHKFSDRSVESGIEAKRRARSSGSRATSATTGSSEDGSSGQHEDYDTEDIVTEEDTESSSDYEEETSGDEDSGGGSQSGASIRPGIDLEIGATLKRVLEQDHDLIVDKNKLAVLPAQPTVTNILESWIQHYTTTQLTNIPEKPQRNKIQNSLEKTISDINICREIADGLRIYFDITLSDLLLYKQEKEQYSTMKLIPAITSTEEATSLKEEIGDSDIVIKEEVEDPEFSHLPPFREQELEIEKSTAAYITSTKRKLRSCRLNSVEEPKPPRPVEEIKQETGNLSSMNSMASTSSRCSSPRGVTLRMSVPVINSAQITSLLEESNKWRLMPEIIIKEAHPEPSMIYGAVHLVRLFVKLPDLLQMTDIPSKKLKVLLKYLDMFLSYLEMHREWFGEQFYMQKINSSEEATAHP
ncbi:PREDICTED: male-specific lethal 3 homolog [Ceratosolen solmsi marchali]|uniref:Protein male-specific lethal-3 n=1 Tax=Ceratosolen solmsi marchali TaxID=326594 RepID=A0AAJ7DYH0_9HYME|nr:PREDICTED: male-specific lethal 3 homolog [Ceratosolen solmsi marchali]